MGPGEKGVTLWTALRKKGERMAAKDSESLESGRYWQSIDSSSCVAEHRVLHMMASGWWLAVNRYVCVCVSLRPGPVHKLQLGLLLNETIRHRTNHTPQNAIRSGTIVTSYYLRGPGREVRCPMLLHKTAYRKA